MSARFITLEGIEGSGKSTVTRELAARLLALGHDVRTTREPGGSPLAERLRGIVLDRGNEEVTPTAETLLMFSARALHLQHLVRPALAQGAWVICDRFTDATRAYQGGGRGVERALIETLARAVHGDLWPQRTLLLDLEPTLGLARARARGEAMDRFESETLAFFGRVRAAYLQIALEEPQRLRVIDAAQPLQQVLDQALRAALDD